MTFLIVAGLHALPIIFDNVLDPTGSADEM
jgi:hypothetical protein